ncbi:MAG: aldo/keto reductase [Actinobacteria bacterium]|nr:aldo/keto reductase [Actinomycetota bacterium]
MSVNRLGLGTAPLGNLFTAIPDDDALATVWAAWEQGVRFFDTAPQYGHGLAETRLGEVLVGLPRDEFVLASKVGRLLRHPDGARPSTIFRDVPEVDPVFDFSRDGVLRSLEESLQRLRTDRLDVVHVHDPDDHEAEAMTSAFPTLIELREQGVIRQVGCGMNQAAMLGRFVERVDLDCVLLAGRYSLLDRSGGALLELCRARDVEVILGGVFNSGLLARPEVDATFDYATASAALVARARSMQSVCASFGVTLPEAAVQFALRHPAVSTVLVGARSVQEVVDDVSYATSTVPADLWSALEAVVRQE